MDLQNRVSYPRLTGPAPDGKVLERILRAGLRAPDHALLRPWRFLVYQEESLDQLSEVFVNAGASEGELTEAQIQKLRNMPHRAPMLIVGIVCYREHPKVPKKEQLLSAGAALSYILAALQDEQYGGMWRTGPMATHPVVRKGLGLAVNEEVIGFLYAGTPCGDAKKIPELAIEDFFQFR